MWGRWAESSPVTPTANFRSMALKGCMTRWNTNSTGATRAATRMGRPTAIPLGLTSPIRMTANRDTTLDTAAAARETSANRRVRRKLTVKKRTFTTVLPSKTALSKP